MARRMNYSARFTYSTEQVYAALSSRDHWDARIEEMKKYSHNELISFEVGESGIDVVMHHIIPKTELPDIAQTVMKKDMIITRNVHIDSYSEETTGHYDASIPAGPGSLKGVTSLFPTATGSTLRTSSEAKVFLPFIGGKLEQLMLVNLRDLWRGEGEVTADWLEKNA
ncbi:DUF2505 domain-containing protein [Rhodococcus sp. BGS-1C]|jgi:hypothetical protein|uniref:DUF2505 domain-containing protein n=1 Tax=unclassified Rhodococcus (in: high G+C Gram-positive bacteria) TaxID=192944 RepID=UPI00095C0D84|nr:MULTISPECIES: DUF2505 domain-containing protein [unclassified Rhodococcus (in: high G+C Gram-positive bacteria)]MCC8926668.1 DUF2505 domain-containing protein [Rhodococcus sp. I2R]OLT34441.1 hypothetical protein BJF84_18185 [Rhodococcus sp. CUA-806]